MAKATSIPILEDPKVAASPEPAKAETPEAPKPARSRIKRPDAQAAAKIDYILGCLEPAEAQRALAMVNAWYQPTGEAK